MYPYEAERWRTCYDICFLLVDFTDVDPQLPKIQFNVKISTIPGRLADGA
jgi:hypothetical protein